MPIESLDHFNIRTAHIADTLEFYRDVLQLDVTPPPGCNGTERSAWVLDSHGAAVIHIGSTGDPYPREIDSPVPSTEGSGRIHHIAFNCVDYGGMRCRLRELRLDFVESHMEDINLRQMFVHDPNGILIELNFRGEGSVRTM